MTNLIPRDPHQNMHCDRNGLTPDELRAILTQVAIYCGFPVAVDCFRIGRQILNEAKKT